MVLAPVLCRAGACTEHLLIPTSQGEGSPFLSMPGTHTNSAARPTTMSLMLCSVLLTLLSIFKGSCFPPMPLQVLFSSCEIARYLQKQSIQRHKGEWTNVTSQTHRSAPDLHPALSHHKLGGEGEEERLKGRQYRNIFNHLL